MDYDELIDLLMAASKRLRWIDRHTEGPSNGRAFAQTAAALVERVTNELIDRANAEAKGDAR